ncbi:nickel ABC transporter ATP-binding protein NikE [Microvirga makkahensis]|uniref:Nickel ABC transporter ATP-binding protein NikE n=2 Tax=Microvirga makkahensis TaxID=1128670 RepID=A0A7X3SMS7_9HYPH|nr:ABC transporter ATP-binding protein [Microvirga makkahensis]MXQ10550.1 nickel ABC transporter ATP-binding protein NikE [Microvirga makkahensis]
MGTSVLTVDHLGIATKAGHKVLDDVSLQVRRGEVLALIGASGSGKTTLALAALGHMRPGLEHVGGSVNLNGVDVLKAPHPVLNRLRGRIGAYIAQSAAAAFNPRIRLGDQVVESALLHHSQKSAEARARAREVFRYLSLPSPDRIGSRFPYQVSGGQLQRFMIAMGMQEEPLLMVCDEPTSALDVTTQVEVMRLLKRAIRDNNTAALFVSHDLAVVAQIATRIAVMRAGRIVEVGETDQVVNAPREEYTRELIAACTHLSLASLANRPSRLLTAPATALSVQSIVAGYGNVRGGKPQITTLHGVDLEVGKGEIVAVIGESGSGKTTLARVIAGLHAPASGTVALEGEPLAGLDRERTDGQRRRVQLAVQMADTALNPKHRIRRILGRVLRFFHGLRGDAAEARMVDLLAMVSLPANYLERYPTQLSGGEKQRVNLARALAADPDVLICDEITSALDTIVAGQIIDLVKRLRDELGLAIIFISHDLATVASIADRVTVLRHGRVVEAGECTRVLSAPADPYTRLLVASVPELRRGWLEDAAATRKALEVELEMVRPTVAGWNEQAEMMP